MRGNMNKYRSIDLEPLARDILAAAGLEQEKADVVAHGLLEGDLMGATTHGAYAFARLRGRTGKR